MLFLAETSESFGMSFSVPKIDVIPNITINRAPIAPIFIHSIGLVSDLSNGDMNGKIIKE